MNFYQVNQRTTFEKEFKGGYLCCPSGNNGGWPLMRTLQAGDILFHYCSIARRSGSSKLGAVLGVSCVVEIDQQKRVSSQPCDVISHTCIQYLGCHLSEEGFTPTLRERYRQNYRKYWEVHTLPLHARNLPKILHRSPQVYLVAIEDGVARRFLADNEIRLDVLHSPPRLGR